MHINEKEQELIDLLMSANTVLTVKNIAKQLYISEPTARRYLTSLANKGYVVRTHGGAMINYNTSLNKNVPLYLRISSLSEEKNKIAQSAAKLIRDGDVIFLDGSSSSFHLLPYLKNYHNLIVCTNSLKTAITLAEMNIHTIALGGDVNLSNLACNSQETCDMIKNFNADIMFFSCDALSENGELSDNNREASYLRKQFMHNSRVKVLLIDNTKLNKQCWHSLCSLNDIDYCFCDVELPERLNSMVKSNKIINNR